MIIFWIMNEMERRELNKKVWKAKERQNKKVESAFELNI